MRDGVEEGGLCGPCCEATYPQTYPRSPFEPRAGEDPEYVSMTDMGIDDSFDGDSRRASSTLR